MRRKIPGHLTLSVFEAAVRHSSFTLAAQDLALTQSAVCRQIASLESYLGVSLFRRSGRGVVPTPVALAYRQQVTASLDMIERNTAELIAHGEGGGGLTVAALPTFAAKWLIPRLPAFYKANPNITLNLLTRTRPFLFEESLIDAAIFARDANWPGTERTFLMNEDLVAVCSPELIRPRRQVTAADFKRHRLLHLDTRPLAWRQWLEARGLRVEQDTVGPRFELFSFIAESAIHGLGLALVPRFLVKAELAQGVLLEARLPATAADAVMRGSAASINSTAYYLIYPEQRKPNPALALFRDWLVAECAPAEAAKPGRRKRAEPAA